MFKRLISSSVSAVLGRSAESRGAQRRWISTSVPPSSGSGAATDGGAGDDSQSPLLNARHDFIESISDVRTQQAGELVKRVMHARSMRDLWYLRTEFFYLVAQHRDQATAKARLELIDSHFPKRETRRSTRSIGEPGS